MVDSIVVSLNFREIENHIAHTNDTPDMTYTICIFEIFASVNESIYFINVKLVVS